MTLLAPAPGPALATTPLLPEEQGCDFFDLPPGFLEDEMAITRVLAALEEEERNKGNDPISFGGGLPSPKTFDVRRYDRHAQAYFKHVARWARSGDIKAPTHALKVRQALLNYTDTRAQLWLRQHFAYAHSRDMGFQLNPERLVPTQGNTQAIHAVMQFYNQLDVPVAIFCERQAYTGFLTAAKKFKNIHVMSVDMDEDGMKPDHLEASIKEAIDNGMTPGFIYLVPDGGNPSGITISQERRDELYRVTLSESKRTGKVTYIFEDCPYYFIRVGDKGTKYPKPMAANDPAGIVIYAFSASKIGYPAYRVGWLHMPMAWKGLNRAGKPHTLYAETTASIAATTLLHNPEALARFNAQMYDPKTGAMIGLWPRSKRNSAVYRQNMRLLFGGLSTQLVADHPELFQLSLMPSNGFVLTMSFPGLAQHTRFADMSEMARFLLQEHQVIVTPMAGFAPPDIPPGSLDEIARFTFSATPPNRIGEGVDRFTRGVKTAYGLP